MNNLDDLAPIHRALMRHSLAEVVQAVSGGENVDTVDREGRTALFYAVADGNDAIIAKLMEYGSNPNAQDKNCETPLHFAARAYQVGAAKLLIDADANVDAQDVHGNPPLLASCI
jgi:ankyrin repeat protein